ncbi:hypothetical protein L2E82_28235 [Cichorium intybus]|uniref:Uncharacterized protein n=1 Tax=Cichorium intybus TaxID=13427 RepID=A0ACB9CV93_CICIN|nr:hypothetical protein L2E82_28235 [Cichorium intybus]
MGTVTGISDMDSVRWKSSQWRNLQTQNDDRLKSLKPSMASKRLFSVKFKEVVSSQHMEIQVMELPNPSEVWSIAKAKLKEGDTLIEHVIEKAVIEKKRMALERALQRKTIQWQKTPEEIKLEPGNGTRREIVGFNWESCRKKWYFDLAPKATDLSRCGITAVWLPPPTESVAPQGYMPSDLYNLYSAYGTPRRAQALGDVVLNHRCVHKQSRNGVWNIFREKLPWGPEAIVCDDRVFRGRGNPSKVTTKSAVFKDKTLKIILYAIAMVDYGQDAGESCKDILKTTEGIDRLALYHSSVGRQVAFNSACIVCVCMTLLETCYLSNICCITWLFRFPNALGALIYPIYGQGELPQAFCRRAAVKGCLYVLRMPVISILLNKDSGNYRGVKLVSGQELTSDKLATSIRILQLGSNLAVCPSGMFVFYISVVCYDALEGKKSLRAAIDGLFSVHTDQTDSNEFKPSLHRRLGFSALVCVAVVSDSGGGAGRTSTMVSEGIIEKRTTLAVIGMYLLATSIIIVILGHLTWIYSSIQQ